jgi:hypothetical protein
MTVRLTKYNNNQLEARLTKYNYHQMEVRLTKYNNHQMEVRLTKYNNNQLEVRLTVPGIIMSSPPFSSLLWRRRRKGGGVTGLVAEDQMKQSSQRALGLPRQRLGCFIIQSLGAFSPTQLQHLLDPTRHDPRSLSPLLQTLTPSVFMGPYGLQKP